ncbi:MAG TPA: hypothetical protein V6C76_16970 [Drouetiella sp.]
MSSTPELNKPAIAADDMIESKQQPLWHVVVLNVMTLSAYSMVWFWKTWKDLADHANNVDPDTPADPALLKFKNVSPMLMTMCALIPVVQLFSTALLFTRVAELYPDKTSLFHRKPIATGISMTVVMFLLFWLYKLPGPLTLLFLLYVAPFVVAQYWINTFWKTQEGSNVLLRQAFSGGELASLFLGAILLGLIVTGFAIAH